MKKYLLKLMAADLKWLEKQLKHMNEWNATQTNFLYKKKRIAALTTKIKIVERYVERIEKLFT